jgi:K+/H+ antiporter YhaU regulatory subunit KhtT
MNWERVTLPGVGYSVSFVTRSGERVGVIRQTDGQRKLIRYAANDPDTVRDTLTLTAEEALALAIFLEE